MQRKVTKEMWALWRCKVHFISLFNSSVLFLSKSSRWSLAPLQGSLNGFLWCKSGTSSSRFVCYISIKKCTGQTRRHISIMVLIVKKSTMGHSVHLTPPCWKLLDLQLTRSPLIWNVFEFLFKLIFFSFSFWTVF